MAQDKVTLNEIVTAVREITFDRFIIPAFALKEMGEDVFVSIDKTYTPEVNEGEDAIKGKLVISKETLDNIISGIAKDIAGTESTSSKTIVDKNRNLKVYVTTLVNKDVLIKDVSSELQDKIIEAMKKTADLDVKEVNIKVKNITSKKLKGLPSRKIAELPEETVTETEEPMMETENTQDEEV